MGYVCGDSGLIMKTVDGGLNWTIQTTGTFLKFKKIFFVNDSIGYALAGQNLFKTNQYVNTGWEDLESNKNIIQAYPNPSNEEFTIKLPQQFNREGRLTITVVNGLGSVSEREQVSITGDNITYVLKSKVKGIYYISISNGTQTIKGKVMVN